VRNLLGVLVDYSVSYLLCCEKTSPGQSIEGVLPNGLILGHAYSITSVKQVMNLSPNLFCYNYTKFN